ncbi:MAG: hypothetical protein EAZ57_10140 [Cytophagales bacterium]|nr:MAG: hypothetical protein EAZ67_05930 [Cytophagales bacterium]TAF59693.1 MAG: hypothetical protein EAZ57_10140 [Cytophagales bacterium]
MTKQAKHIDSLFKDKLANYEVVPSAKAWERIQKPQQSPKWLWWFLPLALLGLSLAYYQITKGNHDAAVQTAAMQNLKQVETHESQNIAPIAASQLSEATKPILKTEQAPKLDNPKTSRKIALQTSSRVDKLKKGKNKSKQVTPIKEDTNLGLVAFAADMPDSLPIQASSGDNSDKPSHVIKYADEMQSPSYSVSVMLGEAGSAEESDERLPVDPRYLKESSKNPLVRTLHKMGEWLKKLKDRI